MKVGASPLVSIRMRFLHSGRRYRTTSRCFQTHPWFTRILLFGLSRPSRFAASNTRLTRNSTIQCFLVYFQVNPTLPFPVVSQVPPKSQSSAPVYSSQRATSFLSAPDIQTFRTSDANTYPTSQKLPPSSASRGVNISPVLSSFRILAVATGVYYPSSFPTFRLSDLRACQLSCLHRLAASLASPKKSSPLRSSKSSLFLQTIRGGWWRAADHLFL